MGGIKVRAPYHKMRWRGAAKRTKCGGLFANGALQLGGCGNVAAGAQVVGAVRTEQIAGRHRAILSSRWALR